MRFAPAIAIPPSSFNDDFSERRRRSESFQSHQLFVDLFPTFVARRRSGVGRRDLVHAAERPSAGTREIQHARWLTPAVPSPQGKIRGESAISRDAQRCSRITLCVSGARRHDEVLGLSCLERSAGPRIDLRREPERLLPLSGHGRRSPPLPEALRRRRPGRGARSRPASGGPWRQCRGPSRGGGGGRVRAAS